MNRADNSFKRRNRLKSSREFKRTFRKGKKRSGRLLTIHIIEAADDDCRLGLVVGKKVGGAVVRNRVKRLIREAFRHIKNDLSPGTRLVVRAAPDCEGASGSEVSDELRRLLSIEETGRVR